MQISFTHYENHNNGGKLNGNRHHNDNRLRNNRDCHQVNGSRNEIFGENGSDNSGHQLNNTNLEFFSKALKVPPKKVNLIPRTLREM